VTDPLPASIDRYLPLEASSGVAELLAGVGAG